MITSTDQHRTTVREAGSTATGTSVVAAAVTSPRRFRRLIRAFGVAALSLGLFTAVAPAASASVSAGAASAQETVFCNSSNHTITVTINTIPNINSSVITGSDLFPVYAKWPVFVRISAYTNGRWATASWKQITTSQSTTAYAGTSYWYFDYAFQTGPNTFDYRSEYAGGAASPGWYSDQRGYRTLTSCVS